MNFRLTAILLAVVLLLVVGLLVSTLMDDKPPTDGLLLAPLDGLTAADIDIVEIVKGDEKLTFARSGKDRWEAREPSPGRIDAQHLNRVIGELLKLKPTISKDLTGDPARHGLDVPGLKVTLRHGNAKSATLLVGDTTLGGDRAVTFVATPDRPATPLAVKQADLASLFKDGSKDGASATLARGLSDYRLKRLFGVGNANSFETATALKIKAGGKELAFTRSGSDWLFAIPAGYGRVELAGETTAKPDSINGLRNLFGILSSFAAATAADFIEAPESLDKYGLAATDPNLIRIEITPKDGPPDVLLIGKKVEGSTSVQYYAQVPGERCVVKLATDRIATMTALVADPKPLQDRTLIAEQDLSRIDAVTITAGSSVTQLRRIAFTGLQRWVLYNGPNDPQFAGTTVMSLLGELSMPRVATDVVVPPNDAAFLPAEIKSEIKLWVDGFEKAPDVKGDAIPPEPKLKGPPTMTLLFGKTDGESVLVRRILADGTKTDLKVPVTLAARAAKNRLEYLDLKFKEFATNTAKKLAFNRGTEVFDISRSDGPEADFPLGKWTFNAPPAFKGQVADVDKIGGGTSIGAGLIGTLSTLSASSAVSESPTEAELKIWGLEPSAPRLKATVSFDGKDGGDKERVYHFGYETADKAYVFFRQPGTATVFQVPRVAVDAFFTSDLRDRTPYRLDLSKVNSIRLRWWKQKAVTEVTFEKQGTDWMAKTAPPYKANPIMMQNLLNHLRGPKPIAVLGAVKTEHGFGAGDADPLEVAFFDAAGKEILSATLGNETDGGASLFVWNGITKETITLPNVLFKPFKESVDAFKPRGQP